MLVTILNAYGINSEQATITPYGNGLINNTWLVSCPLQRYVLQRINDQVFKKPLQIAANIENIGQFLQTQMPSYLFVQPLKTSDGSGLLQHPSEGWFRLFPFIEGSHTIDVVHSSVEAQEAAAQFGRFTKELREFNADSLYETLPDFHNLGLRFKQFKQSIESAPLLRKEKAVALIDYLLAQSGIVDTYNTITRNSSFKKRVTHHDTKISNVLFDENGKGLCVIDLDTVMPGYFISDVGDMMRTYLAPVSEEENDYSKIVIRDSFFYAIAEGYLTEMRDALTADEINHFVYAGKFLIYMQALRFLTDYLNKDSYYGQRYEGHNLIRAGNQAVLLEKLIEKEDEFQRSIIDRWHLVAP